MIEVFEWMPPENNVPVYRGKGFPRAGDCRSPLPILLKGGAPQAPEFGGGASLGLNDEPVWSATLLRRDGVCSFPELIRSSVCSSPSHTTSLCRLSQLGIVPRARLQELLSKRVGGFAPFTVKGVPNLPLSVLRPSFVQAG